MENKKIITNSVLTLEQKDFLRAFLQTDLKKTFYLTGGTALAAFYLQHRDSDDLDFFTEIQFDIEPILSFLKSLSKIKNFDFEKKFDRRIFLLHYQDKQKKLKVEFTQYPFSAVKKRRKVDGLYIDSLEDILVNKLMALSDRCDPKDYVDLYFILKGQPRFKLGKFITKAEKKFGIRGLKYIISAHLLEKIDYSPVSFIKPVSFKEMSSFLQKTARGLL